MEKFTSIESFKHIVANIRKYYDKIGKSYPTITFIGTEKLHGSNCGYRRSASGKFYPQSRERILDITSDNYGFAMFCAQHQDAIEKLFEGFPSDQDITLYGEWCGSNIQKHVALNQVPKHWVLFAAKAGKDGYAKYIELPPDLHDNENGIYNIYQIPTFEVEIDFLNPTPASELLEKYTLEVEERSLWVSSIFNVNDGNMTGEGLVWHAKDDPTNSHLWFKTKGLLHKGSDKTKTPKIIISDEKLESIRDLTNIILPEWRLEQGVTHVIEQGLPILPESIPVFMKFIANDIIKEEMNAIVASGFDWKQIQKQVMQTARVYFLNLTNRID